MAKSNVTITIPPELKREAAILAARRGTTVSGLVALLLKESVDQSKNGPLTVREFLEEIRRSDAARKPARRAKRPAASKRRKTA